MPFVIPSVTTRDRVKAIFQSKVVRPHEELLEWLDEVVPEILSSISGEKQHDFAVPKTPRQKAKTRTRAAQKVPLNLDDLKPISLRSMRYETRLRKKSSSIRKSKSVKLTNAKVSLICEALASLDDNDKTPIATKRQESPLLIDLDKTLNEENEPVAIEPPRKVFRTKKVITQEEQHENLLKSPESRISPKNRRFSFLGNDFSAGTSTVGVENVRKTRSVRAENDGIDQLKITRKTRSIRSKKDENIAHITEIREQQTAASTILEPLVVAGEEVMRRESISPIKENEPNQSKRSKLDQIDRPKSNDLFFDDRPKIQESIIDQSSTMYVMDFDANTTNLTPVKTKSPIIEEDEVQEQTTTSTKNYADKIYKSTLVLSKITENLVEKSSKPAAVTTTIEQIPSSENHILQLGKVEEKGSSSIKTFSKIAPIATTKLPLLPPVTLLPSKSKKPSAQIVLTKSPVNDVRTTRSKARQKVQNENHNKDEGVMKPNQIPNLKISSASSSSSSTLTTMSGMKTPSTLTKTSKYFNTLISNSGLKNKTPNTSSNNLFNSLFSINSSKKLTSAVPPNMASSNVGSFIKRNTPIKITQKEAEAQLLEKIKQQDAKQQEAREKKDEFLKNKAEENKRLREEREQKAAAKRKQLEEENKRKMEQKAASKVLETKNLQQQKIANHEAKRKLDEEREKLKIKKEMEEKLEAEKKAQVQNVLDVVEKLELNLLYIFKTVAATIVKPKIAPIKIKEQEQPSSSTYEMTPADVKRGKKPMKNKNDYGIDDLDSGDETDEAESPKKPIPAWAQGVCFKAALVNQAYSNIDPMSIFGLMNEKVDLEKIFNDKRKRYHVRTSSGIWPETSFFAFGVPADEDDGEH